jgi:hypothetical protein
MLKLKLSTLRMEILQLSLNVDKSQLIKDKEIINDFKSNIKEKPIIDKGALF